ncbi:MAG: DUF3299 domain-containing protein [Planctomycetota bacterium]
MRTLSQLCGLMVSALVLVACGDQRPIAPAGTATVATGRSFYDPGAAARAEAERAAQAAAAAPVDATPADTSTDAASSAEVGVAVPEGGADSAGDSEDPLAKFGLTRDSDGYVQINFRDLSLDGLDQELLIEKLLYPEDYKDEPIDWPARVRALDGEKVALTGYMIPILWKDTTVPHFMLVRDLLACCFGGAPKADEWCDVVMQGEGAGYWSYVPVITRGVFHLTGIADDAGYASGGYTIDGQDVRREL